MPDIPTRADLFELGRQYVLQRAARIDPSLVDVEGSDVNLIVGVTSVVGDAVVKHLGYRVAALFLSTAEGEDLDRWVFDRYQLTRKGAAAARGSVTLIRPTAAGGAGTIPTGTKVTTDGGVEYLLTTSATFGASDLESSADIRAVLAGKATQITANQITRFSQPGILFDQSIAPSNPLATAGGEDEEDDETFRNRVREFWRAARRGTIGAIEFGALTVAGVVSAQAVEVLNGDGDPARVVNLYVADSSGVSSEQLANDVNVALNEYRAGGIAVLISTSLPQAVTILLRLRFRAGVDTAALTDTIRAAVVSFINSLPVNGPLYLGALFSVLQRYVEDGLVLDRDTIVEPAGDIIPSVGQTIRVTLTNVTTVAP
jgi:uncharacterized phage protein gp47/JayE